MFLRHRPYFYLYNETFRSFCNKGLTFFRHDMKKGSTTQDKLFRQPFDMFFVTYVAQSLALADSTCISEVMPITYFFVIILILFLMQVCSEQAKTWKWTWTNYDTLLHSSMSTTVCDHSYWREASFDISKTPNLNYSVCTFIRCNIVWGS